MEQNSSIVKKVRYSFRLLHSRSWSSLMANGTVAYCATREKARAYLPTILANVECDGVQIVEEIYWVKTQ